MRVLILVFAVLMLTACTSDPAPGPPTSTAPPPPAPKPAPHPPAPRVQDRDDAAVLDALASTNPCALVKGERMSLWGPHRCTLATKDSASIEVYFTERTARADRFALPSKVIGGARVDAIKKTYGKCTMEIPVSFRYAVGLSAGRCEPLDAVAATVVARLAAVSKVRHPADQPDLSKDACDVVAGAFTDVGHQARSVQRVDLDVCDGVLPQFGKVSFQQFIQRAPPDGQWWTKWATIAGKQVYLNRRGCEWMWNEGPYAGDRARTVDFAVECTSTELAPDLAKKLILAMMTRLGRPQPPVKVTRLTYQAGEPDEPNPGACVDYQPEACEPFQPTPVPAGAEPATRMAQADSHVTCAAALDAVRGQFPASRPVVDTQQLTCVFVQPDRAVELSVDVLLRNDTGYRPATTRTLAVGGRPAEYREYRKPLMSSLCVDSGVRSSYGSNNLLWCVTATFRAPRAAPTAEPDTSGGSRLAPLMAGIVAKYLA